MSTYFEVSADFFVECQEPCQWYFLPCCQGGVQRVHLLDGTKEGVLLLELFKRDGMGTMVARYANFAVNVFQNIWFVSLKLTIYILYAPMFLLNVFVISI